jgi:hypothetical protein
VAHDVFICYSDADRQTAEAACATLEADGISCWIAPRNIIAGGSWTEALMDAISGSRVMVVIWSASASSSPYVALEVKHACTQGVTVILFRVENVRPLRDLNFFLAFVQWPDAWTPPLEGHYRRLAETVKARLNADTDAFTTWADEVRTRPLGPVTGGRKAWRRLRWPAALVVLLFICAGYFALTRQSSPGRPLPEYGKFQIKEQDEQAHIISSYPASAKDTSLPDDIQSLDTKDGKISIGIFNKTVIVIVHNDDGSSITLNCGCRVKKPEFFPSSTENMLRIICDNGDVYLHDTKTGTTCFRYSSHNQAGHCTPISIERRH